MTKKLLVSLGILVLSSISFAAPTKQAATRPSAGGSIENSLNNLENQLSRLQQMEDSKFREQEAQANAAVQRLSNYNAMQVKIDQRIAEIEANAEASIFGKEFKAKIAEYKNLRNQLDKEIAKEQQAIENFELIRSLRQ
ncbi:adhesion protein FadA [Leptotrichia sp. oral taxon 879]|uniref:Adhesion protein FadA n=1 Tax=Leptotrichia mesophila TaxID=3239303 RepID=A0AB39V9V7_9FUSO|nr:adhesion protein FadA [Leptotrichia sp. oral taxon 879]ERK48411.1 adhesion protein FadA [Leptotrichia sp. oral taxon 879 str. F0557]